MVPGIVKEIKAMKYKNIYSAIHNFGHSFLSLMNYIDDGYVIDDLNDIVKKGYDIEIDWLDKTFKPINESTKRINTSIDYYKADLKRHLLAQQINLESIQELKLLWPAKGRKYMWAKDDRGKEYTIYVSEIK